jgi:hypothetical protein
LPTATWNAVGKAFATCFSAFADCFWQSAKRGIPVVRKKHGWIDGDEFRRRLEELGYGGNGEKEGSTDGSGFKTASVSLPGAPAAAWLLHAGSCVSTCTRATENGQRAATDSEADRLLAGFTVHSLAGLLSAFYLLILCRKLISTFNKS